MDVHKSYYESTSVEKQNLCQERDDAIAERDALQGKLDASLAENERLITELHRKESKHQVCIPDLDWYCSCGSSCDTCSQTFPYRAPILAVSSAYLMGTALFFILYCLPKVELVVRWRRRC